ncbi:MAG TPA: S1 family peptidase [Pseudolabrys sp.]|nr:S1 family peptidase [Pseudolabrys sp.]
MRAVLALLFYSLASPALAIVGGAPEAPTAPRSTVMIVGSGGTFCTGTAVARDLVLTAAHCVLPGAVYKLIEFDRQHQPILLDTGEIARHPLFNLQTLFAHRATADVALIRMRAPLPAAIAPTRLAAPRVPPSPGDHYSVLGYGLAVRGDDRTSGTLRRADLVATGKPGNLQIRLVDPATNGESPGLGACTGDSGAPVFAGGSSAEIIGVVSWSTGPKLSGGCGGLTGVTPLVLYKEWILQTARRMGSPLAP